LEPRLLPKDILRKEGHAGPEGDLWICMGGESGFNDLGITKRQLKKRQPQSLGGGVKYDNIGLTQRGGTVKTTEPKIKTIKGNMGKGGGSDRSVYRNWPGGLKPQRPKRKLRTDKKTEASWRAERVLRRELATRGRTRSTGCMKGLVTRGGAGGRGESELCGGRKEEGKGNTQFRGRPNREKKRKGTKRAGEKCKLLRKLGTWAKG